MLDWIRSHFAKRARLRKLWVEHARSIAHRNALLNIGTKTDGERPALALALRQIDLQIAAVEHDIRHLDEEPATQVTVKNKWVR